MRMGKQILLKESKCLPISRFAAAIFVLELAISYKAMLNCNKFIH